MAYTNAELQQLLQGAGQFGINRFGGPSFNDQRRNANAQMRALNGLTIGTDITQDQYDVTKAGIKASRNSAIAGGIMAGLSGAADIINNASNLSQIANTDTLQDQIDAVAEIGNTDYNSFDQLYSDYDRLAASPLRVDYQDVRGKTDGELIGGVASSALSGAATGFTVGGPVGAAIGGAIGLGAGVGGGLVGNTNARNKKAQLELNADIANQQAQRNLSLANEDMMEYDFRSGVSHRADQGGRIQRRERSIQDFAARALRKPRMREDYVSPISVKHSQGGTIVRIKR